jgi:hypothetical protein
MIQYERCRELEMVRAARARERGGVPRGVPKGGARQPHIVQRAQLREWKNIPQTTVCKHGIRAVKEGTSCIRRDDAGVRQHAEVSKRA